MSGRKTKIQELYSSMSRVEIDEMSSMMSLPFFNQSELLIKLHHILSQENFIEEFDKEEVYKLLYGPNEEYNDLNLRVNTSKLIKLIEKFLIIKNIDEIPIAEVEVLSNHFRDNNLEKNYHSYFKLTKSRNFASYDDYLQFQYNYANRKYEYISYKFSSDRSKLKNQLEEIFNIRKKLKAFRTLKFMCDVKSYQQKYLSDSEMNEYDKEIEELNVNRDSLELIMQLYIYVYYLYKDSSEEEFLKAKEIVITQKLEYESNLFGILGHMQNFCIRFINSGKSDYLSHLFDLYELRLQYFKKQGDLSSANFRNIVYCALQLEKVEWSEMFVENYNQYMNDDERENAYNFNYARIYFEKHEYKKAMRQLLKVTYEDAFYATTARVLLIKCYYELDDYQPLLSCCSSLIQYLKRSKSFTEQRIANIRAFVKYIKLIQKNRLNQSAGYYKKLSKTIADKQTLEKEWLIHKCSELA